MLRSGVNRSQAQVATHIRTNQQSFSRHQVFSEKLGMRGVAFAEARCDFQVITPEETPKWSACARRDRWWSLSVFDSRPAAWDHSGEDRSGLGQARCHSSSAAEAERWAKPKLRGTRRR